MWPPIGSPVPELYYSTTFTLTVVIAQFFFFVLAVIAICQSHLWSRSWCPYISRIWRNCRSGLSGRSQRTRGFRWTESRIVSHFWLTPPMAKLSGWPVFPSSWKLLLLSLMWEVWYLEPAHLRPDHPTPSWTKLRWSRRKAMEDSDIFKCIYNPDQFKPIWNQDKTITIYTARCDYTWGKNPWLCHWGGWLHNRLTLAPPIGPGRGAHGCAMGRFLHIAASLPPDQH